MELLKCDLEAYLKTPEISRLSPNDWQRRSWALTQQLVECYDACHKLSLCHRDVKPKNVLVADDPSAPFGVRLKLCDFAHAKLANSTGQTKTTILVTVGGGWDSPEVCQAALISSSAEFTYVPATDMWGVACLLFYITYCGKQTLFKDSKQILKAGREPDFLQSCLNAHNLKHDDPLLYDLLERMLQPSDKRISSANALLHPYFWTAKDVFNVMVISEQVNDEKTSLPNLHSSLRQAAPRVFGWAPIPWLRQSCECT
eukprot:m.397334 g.397334  ORF g.397334 m.397334 type:complete len:257 (-) comp56420_c0_seq4:124-894(-)